MDKGDKSSSAKCMVPRASRVSSRVSFAPGLSGLPPRRGGTSARESFIAQDETNKFDCSAAGIPVEFHVARLLQESINSPGPRTGGREKNDGGTTNL
jgi:hypothetical protein